MSAKDYISGSFDAFDQVLNFINTLENKEIPKKVFYKAVMDMRPDYQKAQRLDIQNCRQASASSDASGKSSESTPSDPR